MRMMRPNWPRGAVLSALVVIVAAVGCKSPSAEVAVGAALPLTGVVSYYGQDSKRGIDLAVDEINTAGGINGRPLKIIYEDTQGKGAVAVSAIRSLLDIRGVVAVIGGGTSTETLAMAPVAETAARVLLSPVSSASKITYAGDYIFRSVPSDFAQAESLARWVLERDYQDVALIFVNQAWGSGLKDDFVANFQRMGGKILVTESTEQGEPDFRTQLARMRAAKPAAYVAIIYAHEGGLLLRQARELGISEQFFGADPWTKKEFPEAAGDAANGVLFTTPAVYNGPEFDGFAQKYRRRYQQAPGIYEAHGYDCAMLLAEAMRKGGVEPRAIRDALASIQHHMGATGDTTFDKNGDVQSKGFARLTWRNGERKRVE